MARARHRRRAGGLQCATLSMLTYYRTSRSSHFPFWAVCSLSGSQPEIWSVSWKPRVHRIACRLFLSIRRSGVPARRRVSGPRAPLARFTRANTARGGSEEAAGGHLSNGRELEPATMKGFQFRFLPVGCFGSCPQMQDPTFKFLSVHDLAPRLLHNTQCTRA